jgi:photosystem II stability/assembly factor-like uncharacterized protein
MQLERRGTNHEERTTINERRITKIISAAALIIFLALPSRVDAAPKPVDLTNVQMMTVHTGWGSTQSTIVHTVDGGLRWQNVTPPPVAKAAFISSALVDPVDGRAAWLAAPSASAANVGLIAITIFHTRNSGRSWSRLQTLRLGRFIAIDHLQFVDDKRGWLVVTRDAGMSQISFDIYRTVDGGSHWSSILKEGPMYRNPSHSGLLPWCDCGQAFNFVSPSVGWMGACSCALASGLQFYKTTDGGRSWRRYSLKMPRGYRFDATAIGAPVFFSPRAAVLAVFLLNSSSRAYFIEYHSADGGRTWSGSTPIKVALYDDPVSFPDAMHVFLQDGQTLYRSANGGRTWGRTHSILTRDNLMRLQFVTPTIGFAVEGVGATHHTHLLRTVDAGSTWKIVPTSSG